MRIALVYTGYLRSWEQCRSNHKECIYSEETDLFFYTYEKPEFTEYEGIKEFQWNKIHEPFYPDPFKAHKYDERKRPENTIYQTANQWHNNMVSFCLVPTGYDVYVRIRPDIKFNGRLNFHDHDYGGNSIYIPEGNNYGGVNDQFAFGNRKVMKTYHSVYWNCHELWQSGAEFHSEGMQMTNLQHEGINIVRINPQQHIVR